MSSSGPPFMSHWISVKAGALAERLPRGTPPSTIRFLVQSLLSLRKPGVLFREFYPERAKRSASRATALKREDQYLKKKRKNREKTKFSSSDGETDRSPPLLATVEGHGRRCQASGLRPFHSENPLFYDRLVAVCPVTGA